MRFRVILFLALFCVISETCGKPTIYKRNEDNIFEPVMIPVSSTVIPLPVYKVGYGFGFVSKDKKYQSSYKPDGVVKLITENSLFTTGCSSSLRKLCPSGKRPPDTIDRPMSQFVHAKCQPRRSWKKIHRRRKFDETLHLRSSRASRDVTLFGRFKKANIVMHKRFITAATAIQLSQTPSFGKRF